ncbi:MAG TPA: carboxypeptidase-like regulatory domain-containing protein [Methanomassiliicoccales archaeon]|nr:carboxypeptidase-like regulatory domain-containing protein [Methanomassiliicoccales archaeon]
MKKQLLALLALSVVIIGSFAIPSVAAAPYSAYISGSATNGSAQSLAGVNVLAVNVTTHASFSTSTDSTGAYNLSLPSGTYNVSASLENYTAVADFHNVVVSVAAPASLDFVLNEMLGRVTGHVSSGNSALSGAVITLIGAQNYTATSTSPFGEYTISNLSPGEYLAKAEMIGYDTSYHQGVVTVVRGATEQIDFVLTPQFGLLYGKISMGETPLSGVTVTLVSGTSHVLTVQSDASGNYTLTNIVPGNYVIVLTKSGLEDQSVPVSVAPNREQRVDILMQYAPTEGLRGFIGSLDLTHSLMVVALIITLIVIGVAFVVRSKAGKDPDLLAFDEEEEKEEKEQKGKKKSG